MPSPKHRAYGAPVTRGWSRWPRHRDGANGPTNSDGMDEFAAQWAAAMKVREHELQKRRKAACN